MSDFEYDSYDMSTLKIAFQNMKHAEKRGFWMGIALGFPIGHWFVTRKGIEKKFVAGPIFKSLSYLVFGSLM